ncbi:hypothetical protein VTK26DRAFT_3239 [Humicola hyalothermophila]
MGSWKQHSPLFYVCYLGHATQQTLSCITSGCYDRVVENPRPQELSSRSKKVHLLPNNYLSLHTAPAQLTQSSKAGFPQPLKLQCTQYGSMTLPYSPHVQRLDIEGPCTLIAITKLLGNLRLFGLAPSTVSGRRPNSHNAKVLSKSRLLAAQCHQRLVSSEKWRTRSIYLSKPEEAREAAASPMCL